MMREMTEGELHAIFDKGECPNCGSNECAEGPHGGSSMNIECSACKMKFNVPVGFMGRGGQVLEEPQGYIPPDLRLTQDAAVIATSNVESASDSAPRDEFIESKCAPVHADDFPVPAQEADDHLWPIVTGLIAGPAAIMAGGSQLLGITKGMSVWIAVPVTAVGLVALATAIVVAARSTGKARGTA